MLNEPERFVFSPVTAVSYGDELVGKTSENKPELVVASIDGSLAVADNEPAGIQGPTQTCPLALKLFSDMLPLDDQVIDSAAVVPKDDARSNACGPWRNYNGNFCGSTACKEIRLE
jgi:hypothetical protein